MFESLESGWNRRNVWGMEWAENSSRTFSFHFHFLLKDMEPLKDFKYTFRFAIWKAPLGQKFRLDRGVGGEVKPRGRLWYNEGYNNLDNS